MEAIIAIAIIGFLIWPLLTGGNKKKIGGAQLRPHILYRGEYKEVIRRRSVRGRLICTLKPENRGARCAKVAVPFDSIMWLPRGSSSRAKGI